MLIKSENTSTSSGNIIALIDSCIVTNNGYFGNANDATSSSWKAYRIRYSPVFSTHLIEQEIPINVTIINSMFSFNRGAYVACGIASHIPVNTNIALTGLQF